MNQDELITALQKKCSNAIEKLVHMYGNRLLGAAYLLCGDETTSQDLVQETLVQVLQSINNFKRNSTLYTWMYGVLVNKYREHCKKQKRIFYLPQILEKELSKKIVKNTEIQENPHDKIKKELQNLPIKHRQIIILRYYEDMKIEDIALYLKIDKGTVKSRLHYATKKLRNLLAQKENTDEL